VAQLVSSGQKTDTTWFLGGGAGFDFLLTRHLAMRAQVDVVYDHLFNDLLKDGRATVRLQLRPEHQEIALWGSLAGCAPIARRRAAVLNRRRGLHSAPQLFPGVSC
jgi:hypothetical protein